LEWFFIVDQKTTVTPQPSTLERRFYGRSKAFGRFGMRIFKPAVMDRPHQHGHVEANYIRHGRMHYVVDGDSVVVEPNQLIMFWANVPHQLLRVEQTAEQLPMLYNIYLPLDSFLLMSHIPALQIAMLTGGIVQCPGELCDVMQLERWYGDYRSNNAASVDVVKAELNTLFRRISLVPFVFIRQPWEDKSAKSRLASPHVRHVIAMIRHVIENIEHPLSNADITKVTGLHTNYALALFSKIMLLPLKQFVLRMRLLRARGLLLESELAITTVATSSGFNSMSQFYSHFGRAYGTTPMQLRQSVTAISRR
jgi:AraC family transcriptional regulator, melibiose operon regulatory protein